MITLEDFFATAADILDRPLAEEAGDSVSFLPQLQGKPQDKSQRELIMSSLSNKLVLRYKHWKLICVGEHELVDRAESKPLGERKISDPNACPSQKLRPRCPVRSCVIWENGPLASG
jgi:hypothetical protein